MAPYYHSYNNRPIPHHRIVRRRRWPFLLILPVLVVVYVLYALLRPLPEPRLVAMPPVMPAQVAVKIPWPTSGPDEQAAYGARGYGLLATNRDNAAAAPMASVNKVITALAILQKKPLKLGESGPTIPLTENDVKIYQDYAAAGGSVVPVAAGGSMTEYQALQALMLPSANNIADSLAIWAYGSLPAYTAYANSFTKTLGMNRTTVADASGLAPASTSTAADLVLLGEAALANPVLAEVVQQKSAVFPGVGPIQNVNALLGTNGINGIKTGNTDEAGGVFLGAASVPVGGKNITVITAVMSAPNLGSALRDTVPLVQSTPSQFQNVHVLRSGQKVGELRSVWGQNASLKSVKGIDVVSWNGTTLPVVKITADKAELALTDQKLSTDIKVDKKIEPATLRWRLGHPF